VTGATGNVGSLVVERLLARGRRPGVFARDPDKAKARFGDRVDVQRGDLSDAGSLAAAVDGRSVVFLVNAGHDLAVRDKAAAEVAKAAGARVVKLSTIDAEQRNVGTGVWHREGEEAIRASGVAFTFVRPSGFMSNALFWARLIKANGVVRSATGEGRIPFIHPHDIADVSVEALLGEGQDGKAHGITGPEALSYPEMTAKIGAALGRDLRVEPMTDEEVRAEQLSWGVGEPEVLAHVSIYRAIREGRLAEVTDGVEKALGRKPLSFDRWVSENVGAFR
jgi:uncharacterized protein YbjT (DUF2867 family)